MKVAIVSKDETEDALLRCHKSALALGFRQTEMGDKGREDEKQDEGKEANSEGA